MSANPSNDHAVIPIDEMNAWLDTLAGYGDEITEEVLDTTAFAIIGEAQTVAPVKSGTLKAAHHVDDFDGKGVTIGANTDYAWAVHETHATKSHWFLNSINAHFSRIIKGALQIALDKRGMS